MSIQEAPRATAAADCRDNALGQRALDLAQRGPLIVTGLAGIGKSWFLRRLAALAAARGSSPTSPITAVEAYDAHADGAGPIAEALLARLRSPHPERLVLLDGLEALVRSPAAAPLLEAIGRFTGPLVMAAPPAVLSIAALSRCRSLVLPPLSLPERRAFLRKLRDPGAGVDAERASLELDPAWGGHPRVLAQVAALSLLLPTREAPLDALVEAVSERLPGYGAAIAASLSVDEREALRAVAHGQGIPARLRGAALSLTLHGALVRQGDRWVFENRVLARQLARPEPGQ